MNISFDSDGDDDGQNFDRIMAAQMKKKQNKNQTKKGPTPPKTSPDATPKTAQLNDNASQMNPDSTKSRNEILLDEDDFDNGADAPELDDLDLDPMTSHAAAPYNPTPVQNKQSTITTAQLTSTAPSRMTSPEIKTTQVSTNKTSPTLINQPVNKDDVPPPPGYDPDNSPTNQTVPSPHPYQQPQPYSTNFSSTTNQSSTVNKNNIGNNNNNKTTSSPLTTTTPATNLKVKAQNLGPPPPPPVPPPKINKQTTTKSTTSPYNNSNDEYCLPGVQQIIVDDGQNVIKMDARPRVPPTQPLPRNPPHSTYNNNNNQYGNTSSTNNNGSLSTFDRVRVQQQNPRYDFARDDPIPFPVDFEGFVEPVQSRPTRSLEPHPAPPHNTSDLPWVQRDNLHFTVGQPFPIVEPGKQTAYYFPVTITALYQIKTSQLPSFNLDDSIADSIAFSSATTIPHYTMPSAASLAQYPFNTTCWTVNIRFSQFDCLYKSIQAFFPQLPPQLAKVDGATGPVELQARKRRNLMQDLFVNLYDIEFVPFLHDFSHLFLIEKYVTLAPIYPFYVIDQYDLRCNRYEFGRYTGGFKRPSIDTKHRSFVSQSQLFPADYEYGYNHGFFLQGRDFFFTPVQYSGTNISLNKISSVLTSWWGTGKKDVQAELQQSRQSTKDITKEVEPSQSYGGLVVWWFSPNTRTFEIQTILPLDQRVDDVLAVQGDKCINVYLGVSNGQVLHCKFDANNSSSTSSSSSSSNKGLTQKSDLSIQSVDRVHTDQICGLYNHPQIKDSLISVSRDGTICFITGWGVGSPGVNKKYYNTFESLLSSHFALDRYLILGTSTGKLLILDCFAQPQAISPIGRGVGINGSNHINQYHHPYRHGSGNRDIHLQQYDNYFPSNNDPFFPQLIYYQQLHTGGIRHITTSQSIYNNTSNSNNNNTNTSLQYNYHYHNINIPYNLIHRSFHDDEAYNLRLTESALLLKTYQPETTTIHQFQISNYTSMLSHHIGHQTSTSHPPSIYILTSSHDETNKVLLLNQTSFPSQQCVNNMMNNNSLLQTLPILELQHLRCGASHYGFFIPNTTFFVTSHGQKYTKLLLWDLTNFTHGPIFAISTETTQITTMFCLQTDRDCRLVTTSRDGLVKTFQLKEIFDNYLKKKTDKLNEANNKQ